MALFLTKDLDDPVHLRIGVWQISESEAELRAMTSIPSDELEEISYIKSETLRKQKLAVRALLDAMFEDKPIPTPRRHCRPSPWTSPR